MGRGTGPRSFAAQAKRLAVAKAKAAAFTKQQAKRRELGRLSENRVLPYTKVRYRLAVSWFFNWLDNNGFDIPTQTIDFDDVVCEAIEGAWAEGEPRGLIGMVLSGLEFEVQSLRGHLRGAWKLFRLWGTKERPTRVPPLSTDAVISVASYMWDWGYQSAALATLLGFHRFLRTSEFSQALVKHFIITKHGRGAHLMLVTTKTGPLENVSFSDPVLIKVLVRLLEGRRASESFLGLSPYQYRGLFAEAIRASGLPPNFKPYSLRRGGASTYFRETGSMARAMELGRWKDLKTAKIYINLALLDLTEQLALQSPRLSQRADAFWRVLERF